MPRFSERIGAAKPKQIQYDDMDEDLRNSLWNYVYDIHENIDYDYWTGLIRRLALFFFKTPVDQISPYIDIKREWIKAQFYSLNWYEAYDFIEFIVKNHDPTMVIGINLGYGPNSEHHSTQEDLIETFNFILKMEFSGFRFISGVLAPITNEIEIKEIESAIENANEKMIQGVQEHLSQALELLGKKPDPDYRNSIKESISAVGSVAKQISGKEKAASLVVPLKELNDKTDIHPALQEGFNRIYGYTSDEDGIRHSITEEESNAGFEEAQFMLVSCSAFVNFLIAKAEKAGLLEEE
jgi:hypothetical protein